MTLKVQFQDRSLVQWLSEEDRKSRLILLDIDADVSSGNTVRLVFDLVFSPKAVRRKGVVQQSDYYIGSTGAELNVRPTKGRVISHSQPKTIDASYSNSTRVTRNSGLVIEPKVTANLKSAQVKGSVGSVEYKAGLEQQKSSTFQANERWLDIERANPAVKWIVALPRRKSVVRDYLQGNLLLFAECVSLREGIEGTIEVRASDIRFFRPDRSPLGKLGSILMLYEVWRDGINIMSQDPEVMEFKISPLEEKNG